MDGKININYNWTCGQGIEIPEAHKDALKEDAESRIFEKLFEGYNDGMLATTICCDKEVVPDEELTYSGRWSKQ